MIIGHTYPKGQETYLSTVVSRLSVGTGIQLNGHTFVVAAIQSYPKASVPDRFYATAGTSRYLVTCDPHSGYTRWADGLLHSKNNLIVTLDPATP